MTKDLVRDERWYAERDKAFRIIRIALTSAKTRRTKKLSIKKLNMLEAAQYLGLGKETDRPPENTLLAPEPRSTSNWYSRAIASEKRKPAKVENPGW